MFDPAALGTLLIGLGDDRAESRPVRRRRSAGAEDPKLARFRVGLARGFRRAARAVEPRGVEPWMVLAPDEGGAR